MHNRIREIRTREGLTRSEFGRRIGLRQEHIQDLECGQCAVKDSEIRLICMVYQIREEWLRTGEGPMEQNQTLDSIAQAQEASPEDLQFIRLFLSLPPETRGYLTRHFRGSLLKKANEHIASVAAANERKPGEPLHSFVPMYMQPASAGFGDYSDDNSFQMMELSHQPPVGTSYIIRVHGDSMEPTYEDGDLLFVRATDRIGVGKIGVFAFDGDLFVKEAGRHGLISHNESYPIILPSEGAQVQGEVLGVVTEDYLVSD